MTLTGSSSAGCMERSIVEGSEVKRPLAGDSTCLRLEFNISDNFILYVPIKNQTSFNFDRSCLLSVISLESSAIVLTAII